MRASFIHKLHYFHTFGKGEVKSRAREILEHYYQTKSFAEENAKMKTSLPIITTPGGYADTKTAKDRVGSRPLSLWWFALPAVIWLVGQVLLKIYVG